MNTGHEQERLPNPRANANPLSILTFGWIFKTFQEGYKKDLEAEDLYEVLSEHKSDFLGDNLEKLWKSEIENAKRRNREPSLLRVIIRYFGPGIMMSCMIVAICDLCFQVTQPLFLGGLIRYFSQNSNMERTTAYWYAAGVIVCSLVNIFVKQLYLMSMLHFGMKMRIGVCSLIYRKALRLSKTALRETTVGQAVNLLSNDVSRFDRAILFFVYLWFGPIQAVIITYFVWLEIGVASLVGIALILVAIPLQAFLGKMLSAYRFRTAKRTDERIRLMNEIILAIQVIKMYAWEKPFARLVSLARKHEIDVISTKSYVRGLLLCSEKFSTRLSIFIGVVAYVMAGNTITAEKMFVVTAFFYILKITMTEFFPQAIVEFAEALVSVKRIKTMLLYEEKPMIGEMNSNTENGKEMSKKMAVIGNSDCEAHESKTGVRIRNVTAKWCEDLSENTLTDVNVDLKPGALLAVIGPVGAGKSSLLHAILKELPISSGSILVGGKISYASQEPWLFSGSIRQNILFGQPMNRVRYRKVVKVCALERDFELFPYGDKTIVGERGVTLSGGQRARINLARAVYKEADVYLFDDPLSAVDTHVGRHLFDDCICDFLKNTTRVLVTHQLQYLHSADIIVILENGTVKMTGTYNELQKSELDFAKQLQPEDNVEDEMAEKVSLQETGQLLQRQSSIHSQQSSVFEIEPLSVAEMRTIGRVGSYVYRAYLSAGGNWCFILFVLGFCVLSQVAMSGADYWMSYWTKVEEIRNVSSVNKTEAEISWQPDTETCIYVNTGIMLAIIVSTFGCIVSFFKMCMRASKNLHNNMFASITRACMSFFNNNPSGQILNRFSKDMGQIDESLPFTMNDCIQRGLQLVGIIIVVAVVNFWLLIPTALMFVLFSMLRTYYIITSSSIKRLEAITRSPVFSHLSASLQGLTTIRAFGAQALLEKEFDNHQDLHSTAFYLFVALNRAFGLWLDMICVVFIALVTLSFLFIGGEQFGGDVGLAITQAIGLTGLLQWGIRQSAEMENQMTSVERVLEYTAVEKEPPLESSKENKPSDGWPSKGEMVFYKMSLAYSKDEPPVLKNISLTINSAEKIGIVGRTGAGKSSLITALFRLVDLSEGSITIDGINTATIGLHDLRSKISIIPQEPALFSGMLRENLDPFSEYTDGVLWSALEEVELRQAMEELPAGLSHRVSEGGSNFSVGQRQLLCLARAIIRNNKILVMDEATANVDPQTDELIQATIRRKFANCTVLTIAHRLNTVMDSDRILVMDAGSVVEYDHPHNLLKMKSGILYSMVQKTGPAMEEILCRIAEVSYERKCGALLNPD